MHYRFQRFGFWEHLRGSIKSPNFINEQNGIMTISVNKYSYLTMEERIERIGKILAYAVYLCNTRQIETKKDFGLSYNGLNNCRRDATVISQDNFN